MTKILVEREVLEQVLEALALAERTSYSETNQDKFIAAADALRALLDAPSEPAICGVCGYSGTSTDKNGQCPRCHWDELVTPSGGKLRSALNAMLTQFGMDEDEWNKPTFDQARAALDAPSEPKEAFCYCNEDVSLQMVSGGGAPEGYLGKVTLRIGDQYREYRSHPDAPSGTTTAQLVRSDIEIHLAHCFQAPYETSCKYDDADCPATPKETP